MRVTEGGRARAVEAQRAQDRDRQGAADAYLEGAVTDFRTTPVQFNAEGRATRLETAVVAARLACGTSKSGETLWSQANLLFRDQYDVQQAQADYFDLETTCSWTLARGAARTLDRVDHGRLLMAFAVAQRRPVGRPRR